MRCTTNLKDKPTVIRKITLQTAGRQMRLSGAVIGPITLGLGTKCYQEQVYVAPIEDDMLLGLDFLRKHQVSIMMPQGELHLPGETIKLKMTPSSKPKVSRVVVCEKTVVPPNTVKLVQCSTDSEFTTFMVEPVHNTSAMIARTVHKSPAIQVCVVNPSERNIVLKRNMLVGRAHEVVGIVPSGG